MSVINNLQNWLSGGDINSATGLLTNAGKNIAAITPPDLQALIPQLQLQVQQGLITPAQMQAAIQQASELAGVTTDAGTIQGAETGLAGLADIAANGGATQADRAAQTAIQNQTNADRAQATNAIVAKLGAQGLGGSGVEAAIRASGAQGAANANAATGATIAQQEQQRALDAMKAGVTGNTALNQQQFEQAAAKAKAQDTVNAANATARQAAAVKNVDLAQDANKTNFSAANEINKNNTATTNTNLMMPSTAAQNNFTNQLNQQTASSRAQIDAATGLLGQGNKNASGAAAAVGSVWDGVNAAVDANGGWGKTASDVYDWYTSDKNNKTDVHKMSDEEADSMLAKLTGNKYRYKGDNSEQFGVMAQDMEQTPFKHAVVDTPAGKLVNGNAMSGQLLALVSNMNERMRKLEGK